MYKITLACYGVPKAAGPDAATDITKEFAEHRQWHINVSCQWDGERLILEAENDYDSNGLALMDEFSDCISAYIVEPFDGDIKVENITKSEVGNA
jgi:hypothetical protein